MNPAVVARRRLHDWIELVPGGDHLRRVAAPAAAVAVGVGVPLSGFNPFNTAVDVFGVPQAPALVIFTPAVLLGVLALVAAVSAPAPWTWQPDTRLLVAGAVMLLLAALLSLTATDDIWYSILIGTLALAAPAAVAVGVARSRLSPRLIGGAFLLGSSVMLLRADILFVQLHGLPTADALYQAKYVNRAYDFHYYTLANPTGTAAWLLLPFGLALFWATGRCAPRLRLALIAAAGIVGITLVLAYSRSALAVGVLLTVAAVLALPWRPAYRYAVVGVLVVAVSAFALTGVNRGYLRAAFATDSASSGGERLSTIVDGLKVAGDHPLTGVGLGRFNTQSGYIPAHSSVVQAAADVGFLGAAGVLLITIGAIWLAVRRVRADGLGDVRAAAAIAASVYLVYAAFAAGASEALYSGYISVWGLSVALLLGLAAGGDQSARR